MKKLTPLQGQYLAFIQTYTQVHRQPPSEGDLQRYFNTSPPSVHQMVVRLDRLGLIERTPGAPRSIRVRVSPEWLPVLGADASTTDPLPAIGVLSAASSSDIASADEDQLLSAIKMSRGRLEELLRQATDHWGYEDPIYRFYHQSFKVYHLQQTTADIIKALRGLLPGKPLNPWLERIVAGGTGRTFEPEHNRRWPEETRPILEAFFHARYFLEMACRYGRQLETPPQILPSGWAALLCLFGLR